MTEFQMISAVMNLVTANEAVTNTSLSEEQVGDELDTLRGRMIADMDKEGLFRSPYTGFIQTIDNLPVNKATKTELASVEIPKVMYRRDNMPAILYIGGTDMKSPYRVVTGIHVENFQHVRHTSQLPMAYYNEGKITLHNVNPAVITVIAVFNDPTELEVLGKYNSEESQYPVPMGMIDQMIGKTANSYINSMYRLIAQPNTQADIPNVPNAGSKR